MFIYFIFIRMFYVYMRVYDFEMSDFINFICYKKCLEVYKLWGIIIKKILYFKICKLYVI